MADKRSILVVDDERPIRDLLAAVLVEEGYAVRCAADGLAALAEVERQPPDLVVSDVAMPRLDGIALAARLRARGIAVVLVSAIRAAVDLPGVPFIPKPFDLDDVLGTVAKSLEVA